MDRVKLEHIGAGGLEGDKNFVEMLEEKIHEIGPKVLNPECDGKATITAKLIVKSGPQGAVLISSQISVTDPKRKAIGLAAWADGNGGLVTQQHHQEPLPGIANVTSMNPRPIAAGEKETK